MWNHLPLAGHSRWGPCEIIYRWLATLLVAQSQDLVLFTRRKGYFDRLSISLSGPVSVFLYYWLRSLGEVKFMDNTNLLTWSGHGRKYPTAIKCSLGPLSVHGFLVCSPPWGSGVSFRSESIGLSLSSCRTFHLWVSLHFRVLSGELVP